MAPPWPVSSPGEESAPDRPESPRTQRSCRHRCGSDPTARRNPDRPANRPMRPSGGPSTPARRSSTCLWAGTIRAGRRAGTSPSPTPTRRTCSSSPASATPRRARPRRGRRRPCLASSGWADSTRTARFSRTPPRPAPPSTSWARPKTFPSRTTAAATPKVRDAPSPHLSSPVWRPSSAPRTRISAPTRSEPSCSRAPSRWTDTRE